VFSPTRHQGHQAHPPEKPQRHRGTEIAQRFFQIPSQPPRHKDTKKSQSPPTRPGETTDHPDRPRCFRSELGNLALSTSPSPPPAQKRRDAEAQRRREALARFLCVARFRPSDGGVFRLTSSGETPWPSDGHGTTGSGNRLESELSCRFPDPVVCALEERRSRLLFSPFNGWEGHAPHNNTKERQNRRAKGTSAGEKTGGDGCSHPELAGFSPATGDHQSPVVLPPISGTAFQAQRPPLRVFVSLCLRRGWAGGSVSSVPLWFFRRLSSAKILSSLV
jgi:hypothetical protein